MPISKQKRVEGMASITISAIDFRERLRAAAEAMNRFHNLSAGERRALLREVKLIAVQLRGEIVPSDNSLAPKLTAAIQIKRPSLP